MSYQSLRRYVTSVSLQLASPLPALTNIQQITKIGYVMCINYILHYAKLALNTRDHRIH